MTDTLPEFLFHWAERTPAAVFVAEPDRGRTYTYLQVAGAVARLRAKLRRLAVGRGDRVAILADNGCAWVVAYLGSIAQGAIAVPLNTRHPAGDLGRVLDDVGPAAIVGDPPYLERLPDRHRAGVLATTEVDVSGRPGPARDGSE